MGPVQKPFHHSALTAAALVVVLAPAAAGSPPAQDEIIAIRAARMIDGTGAVPSASAGDGLFARP